MQLRPWKVGLAVTAFVVGAWVATGLSQTDQKKPAPPPEPGNGVRSARVTSDSIRRTLRVTGTTSARTFASIAAPMMRGPDSGRALVLMFLAKSGGSVKKGEVVAQIDAQSMKDHVDGIHTDVQAAESDITKRKAEQAIDWENLQQTLRVAKSDLDKAKLDASAAETRTTIDQELLKLSVEEAEAQYKQLQADLKTKKIGYQAEIRILELTRDRHTRHRDRHQHDIEKFTIRAPIDGLCVMQSLWRGTEMGQVQQGDQVAPGQSFMKIVNPDSMQIDGMLSQVGSDEVRIGQAATVRFDAFPDLRLPAKVYSLGAIASGTWRQNYYFRNVPVRLTILGSDSRLIPDLSTSAEIVLDQKDKALLVPLEAVRSQGGKTVLYVWTDGRYQPRAVKVGVANNTHAEISEGVQAGEQVSLDVPAPTKVETAQR